MESTIGLLFEKLSDPSHVRSDFANIVSSTDPELIYQKIREYCKIYRTDYDRLKNFADNFPIKGDKLRINNIYKECLLIFAKTIISDWSLFGSEDYLTDLKVRVDIVKRLGGNSFFNTNKFFIIDDDILNNGAPLNSESPYEAFLGERIKRPEFLTLESSKPDPKRVDRLNNCTSRNILKFYEVRNMEDEEKYFFVFEYIGENLRHLLQRRRLTPKAVVFIFSEVVEGINYTMKCGYGFRRFHPENILIGVNDHGEIIQVKISSAYENEAIEKLIKGALSTYHGKYAQVAIHHRPTLPRSKGIVESLGGILKDMFNNAYPGRELPEFILNMVNLEIDRYGNLRFDPLEQPVTLDMIT